MPEPRVLVVEDDDALRMMLEAALQNLVPTDTARNGLEALQLTDQREYAVIVIDLLMPVMDGMTFLREFRQRYPESKSLIIAATGASLTLGLNQRDVHAIVRKPFDLIALTQIVVKCAKGGRDRVPELRPGSDDRPHAR